VTEQEIGDGWEAMWARISEEYIAAKDSQGAFKALGELYVAQSPYERTVIDRVLGAWLATEDETKRFDALYLIQEARVTSALPALRALAVRLEDSTLPGAPFELTKVRRIMDELASSE